MKHQARQEEWGPWILHDGLGCPVPTGTIVEVRYEDRFGYQSSVITMAVGGDFSSWNWEFYPELKRIIRYRKRRPKGLQILDELMKSTRGKTPSNSARTPDLTNVKVS